MICLGRKIKCYFEEKQKSSSIISFANFCSLLIVWSAPGKPAVDAQLSRLNRGVTVVTFSSPCLICCRHLSLILSVNWVVVPPRSSQQHPFLCSCFSFRGFICHIKDAGLILSFGVSSDVATLCDESVYEKIES